MQASNTPTFAEGDRIRLVADFGFFDQGDQGVINANDGVTAEILFDGGAEGLIPLALLALDVGDFRVLYETGRLSRSHFRTEGAAVDHAEARGCTNFRVLRVAEDVHFTIEPIAGAVVPYVYNPAVDPLAAF